MCFAALPLKGGRQKGRDNPNRSRCRPQPREGARSWDRPRLRRVTRSGRQSCAQPRWRRSEQRCWRCWGYTCAARLPPSPSLSGTGWVSRDRPRGEPREPGPGRDTSAPVGSSRSLLCPSSPALGRPGGADPDPPGLGGAAMFVEAREGGLGSAVMVCGGVPFHRRHLLQSTKHGLH